MVSTFLCCSGGGGRRGEGGEGRPHGGGGARRGRDWVAPGHLGRGLHDVRHHLLAGAALGQRRGLGWDGLQRDPGVEDIFISAKIPLVPGLTCWHSCCWSEARILSWWQSPRCPPRCRCLQSDNLVNSRLNWLGDAFNIQQLNNSGVRGHCPMPKIQMKCSLAWQFLASIPALPDCRGNAIMCR